MMIDEPERIGALWKRESRKGVTYLAGEMDGRKTVVFKVREKRSDKSPDYQVFLARDLSATNANEKEASAAATAKFAALYLPSDEDIPF